MISLTDLLYQMHLYYLIVLYKLMLKIFHATPMVRIEFHFIREEEESIPPVNLWV